MEEKVLNMIKIVSVIDYDNDTCNQNQNESIVLVYPKLCSSRDDFIQHNGKLIHLKISDKLSDGEVQRLCEAISVDSLLKLIDELISSE